MTESIETQCLSEISNLIKKANSTTDHYSQELEKVDPNHLESAQNLLHYCELRKTDLSTLQQKLGSIGLSRLARTEEHVIPILMQVQSVLQRITSFDTSEQKTKTKAHFESLLEIHSRRTLGPDPINRRSRIMVTIPTTAANDALLVKDMIRAGMNVARINCAHDNQRIWFDMIQTIRKASTDLNQPVKIIMDLAGPKVRTQIATKSPEVLKIKPEKNQIGKVTSPKQLPLQVHNKSYLCNSIPIVKNENRKIQNGQTLWLRDARGKKRIITLQRRDETLYASFWKTTYLMTGQSIFLLGKKKAIGRIGKLPETIPYIDVQAGDQLSLCKEGAIDEDGKALNCTLPVAIDAADHSHRVFFDDGKIEGVIVSKQTDKVVVKVTRTQKRVTKLKSEKGINFPDTVLPISGISKKDLTDLEFICKYADGVHVSFISHPSDVSEVIRKLIERQVNETFSLVLKIENKTAFKRLKEILLTALQWKTVGVTIARGDLAIETGWENISRIQKEIIKISNAAHVPVIWATQVLDNLAKNGYPSRSEVTDAASSIRADCVMLNKGPHIIKAIQFLDNLLSDTELFQKKNVAMLPKMLELK